MKHVFVETNFFIEVLRPFPSREAEQLLQRQAGGELRLHVPWCSVAEAKRTLTRLINEDLGFPDSMMKFAVRQFHADPTRFDKREIDKLQLLAKNARTEALRTKNSRIDALAGRLQIIPPSQDVVDTTLQLFDTKSLKPFDEMALGAILTRATDLHRLGERDLYFCTTDENDLGPSEGRPGLQAAYAACGLKFRSVFTL